MTIWLIRMAGVMTAAAAMIAVDDRPQQFGDAQVIIEFQRAADSYAFTHRRQERRGQGPAAGVEGTLFTPTVADAFRRRIRTAMAGGTCRLPDTPGNDFSVPRVNASVAGAPGLPACITSMLPALPAELEYRAAGVALLLADAHLHIVVDVLHGALPPRTP